MVELIAGLGAERVRANLGRIRGEIEAAAQRGIAAGTRTHAGVEILAATKYVALEDMPLLYEGGIRLVGENRAQDLERKIAVHGELFEWDFIGQLQSRKVRTILPNVRLIHSVASDSALTALERYRELARPDLGILIQVNIAGEPGKAGIAPNELGAFLEHAPVPVRGLMGMPPVAHDPQDSRQWFAALRKLANQHGLEQLSMGTTQDYDVAVEEGATTVRIGTRLYA
jgi:hypothetical protein